MHYRYACFKKISFSRILHHKLIVAAYPQLAQLTDLSTEVKYLVKHLQDLVLVEEVLVYITEAGIVSFEYKFRNQSINLYYQPVLTATQHLYSLYSSISNFSPKNTRHFTIHENTFARYFRAFSQSFLYEHPVIDANRLKNLSRELITKIETTLGGDIAALELIANNTN
jgi:hypothetical protein